MIINITVILILLCISIGLIYIVIKSIMINISNNITTNFIDKLSVFDELIEQKRAILLEQNQKNQNNKDVKVKEKIVFREKYITQTNEIVYKDDSFERNYIKIKEQFQNKEKNLEIIKKFINENSNDNILEYQIFVNIEKILSISLVDKLLNLDLSDQINFLKGRFDKQQNIILEDYMYENVFEILDFVEFVVCEKEKYDNKIYLYVSSLDYFELDDNKVCYICDENIIEGFKIKYKNKIYDYSFVKEYYA